MMIEGSVWSDPLLSLATHVAWSPCYRPTTLPAIQETSKLATMKITTDLPEELYRQVKAKAAMEGRAVREVTEALYRAYVQMPDAEARLAEGAAWVERWQRLIPTAPPRSELTARDHLAADRSRLDRP